MVLLRKIRGNRSSGPSYGRRLRYEALEDKRMLAKADIVFAVDESKSEGIASLHEWLTSSVIPQITNHGIDDVKYGLIGFGPSLSQHAHSFLVNPGGSTTADKLLGSQSQLITSINNLQSSLPGLEDAWDGIEHAIAEYRFRDGAVPVVVIIQNEEGRVRQNVTLTREGILAALGSKSVLVNTMVVGAAPFGDGDFREEKGTGVIFLFF